MVQSYSLTKVQTPEESFFTISTYSLRKILTDKKFLQTLSEILLKIKLKDKEHFLEALTELSKALIKAFGEVSPEAPHDPYQILPHIFRFLPLKNFFQELTLRLHFL